MVKHKTRLVNSSGFKANQVNLSQHGRLYNYLLQQPLNLLSVSAFGGRFQAVVFQQGFLIMILTQKMASVVRKSLTCYRAKLEIPIF